MANTKSAKKATRVAARRTEVNKNRVSRIRTYVRKVEEAIASGNQAEAQAALQAAQPELMRGAQKGFCFLRMTRPKASAWSWYWSETGSAVHSPWFISMPWTK